jgi:5'-nucleotidase
MTTAAGGTCEELVAAENGILISMLLRQYFMALRVVDRWRHWGGGLHRHWGGVVAGVDATHSRLAPSSSRRTSASFQAGHGAAESRAGAGGPRQLASDGPTSAGLGGLQAGLAPFDEHVEFHRKAEGEDDGDVGGAQAMHETERALGIKRRVWRKWTRVAGVHGATCDHLSEGEFAVDWTRAVAPRVEGRISMVGE